MKPPKLLETRLVQLDQIDTTDRLRPVSETSVTSLIASIEQLGLQNEIHIRKLPNGLRLIAGGHRIAAFARMGRKEIPAKIWQCCNAWASLTEIDDNLAHAELDPLEIAIFLAERKRVYEEAFPETKAASGAELAAKRWNDASDNVSVASFAAATAEKMGVSDRTVYRMLRAGEALGPAEIAELRNAPKPVTKGDLETIAKCITPSQRYEVCRALSEGKAKTARDALAQSEPQSAAAQLQDPTEKQLKQLLDMWSRCSQAARLRFVAERSIDIAALLEREAAQ